jgi:hypothetical protein
VGPVFGSAVPLTTRLGEKRAATPGPKRDPQILLRSQKKGEVRNNGIANKIPIFSPGKSEQ